ncbi:MAG: hypothetical protein IKW92_00720 [Firmicutes bacterium]|nr:hypothetical protein [Bacillota bacterium]
MMPILLNSILFYYLNGELNGVKDWPDWLTEKVDALEVLLDLEHKDLEENDAGTAAIMDLKEAAELWGFINGIRFVSEIAKEI